MASLLATDLTRMQTLLREIADARQAPRPAAPAPRATRPRRAPPPRAAAPLPPRRLAPALTLPRLDALPRRLGLAR